MVPCLGAPAPRMHHAARNGPEAEDLIAHFDSPAPGGRRATVFVLNTDHAVKLGASQKPTPLMNRCEETVKRPGVSFKLPRRL